MLHLCSGILAKAINTTICSSNKVVTIIVLLHSPLHSAYLVANDLYFSTNKFSKNFSNFLFTCTRCFKNSCFSTMNLFYNRMILYNRIILYNRTISSLALFIFTGVTFGVFNIIYFCSALMALDIGWFWW